MLVKGHKKMTFQYDATTAVPAKLVIAGDTCSSGR